MIIVSVPLLGRNVGHHAEVKIRQVSFWRSQQVSPVRIRVEKA